MSSFLKRAWADISIDNIEHNYKEIKNSLNKDVKIMAVIKADAYGHGVKYIAPVLQKFGTDWFAVSNIEEALQLRSLGITKNILILGYTPPFFAKVLSDNNISQTVFDYDYALQLSNYAKKENVIINTHLKIDTGMSRIGFYHHEFNDDTALNQILEIFKLSNLKNEGIFTHFSSSDLDGDLQGEFTTLQFDLFCDLINNLKNKGIEFQLKHCCNSGAIINYPQMHLDIVRPGIILYGLYPSNKCKDKLNLKPAMTLKSVISMIKDIKKGDFVSYSKTYKAEKNMKVATIPIGYADGYPRCLSNLGYVMINKKSAEILGKVCMDQMVVNVTDIDNLKVGQEVLLFGKDFNGQLDVDKFAAMCNTINYETVCIVGKRVPRVYYYKNNQVGCLNYIYNENEK